MILDDVRSSVRALANIDHSARRLLGDGCAVTIVRPFRHDGERVIADFANALDVVQNNPVFDVWILDNDLAPALEGFSFLRQMCEQRPHLVPALVFSCSSNIARREQIESYGADWRRTIGA